MARRRIVLATVAMLAVTLAADAAARPQNVPFDHYLCYKVTKAKASPPPLVLIDQFDQAEGKRESVHPTKATKLCAPVLEKNHKTVVFDPVIHLTRYPFKSAAPAKTVRVINQFEDVIITTVAPVELMVPTTKDRTSTPPPPTGQEFSYEHYKCYTLQKSTFKKKEVVVTDQFGERTLVVTSRTRLCNPVTKIVGTRTDPIRNPERHLVCYTVKPPSELNPTVFTNNQFGPEQLLLGPAKPGPATELCLPSLKKLQGARNRGSHAR